MKTKASCVGCVPVLTSSVKPVRVRLPHCKVQWFIPNHINFNDQTGTQQDALSRNQLHISTKIALKDLYSIPENQPVYTNRSA